MIKPLVSFFIAIAVLDNAYGGISGSSDRRTVIGWLRDQPEYSRALPSTRNIWNTSPYNSIVFIRNKSGWGGSGEFISPRHVLTNTHVAEKCGVNGKPNCEIYTSDNKKIPARAVLWGIDSVYGGDNWDKWRANENKDWTVLEVADNYCRKEYRAVGDSSLTMKGLWHAGFGGLRVLTQSDISAIRSAYIAYLNAGGKNKYSFGGMTIREADPNFTTEYKVFFNEFSRITGKDFDKDYLNDMWTLKLIQNCEFSGSKNELPGVVRHTCDSWGGDSGSNIKTMSGNRVAGLNSGGWSNITSTSKDDATGTGILSSAFWGASISYLVKKAEQDCKDWKPDDQKPVKPEPIQPQPDKKNCDLTCENVTIYVGGRSGCYRFAENDMKCKSATGKNMRSDGHTTDGAYKYTCVDYDKSPACGGQTPINPEPIKPEPIKPEPIKPEPINPEPIKPEPIKPEPVNPEPTERKVGGQCLESDLSAHAIAGHYIGNGSNKLTCESGPCSCAATECESGYYLAANAKGWSMGWCRSGTCPRGKHANIVNGNRMTVCVDD